jgi:hypothetical protein
VLYAAIDIHKQAFQAAVLDPESGEVAEERFPADREALAVWAARWEGRVGAVAIEATTGSRWVWRELVALGFDVRLSEPVQARALRGRRRGAKTDRLDARWLAELLARELLTESWISASATTPARRRSTIAVRSSSAASTLKTASLNTSTACSSSASAPLELAPASGRAGPLLSTRQAQLGLSARLRPTALGRRPVRMRCRVEMSA